MKHPVPLLMLTILTLVFCGGCSSGPSKHNIEAQLNKYHVFAEPETWYVCLGSVYNDTLYEQVRLVFPSEGCRFSMVSLGVDSQAMQLGLTALQDGDPDTTFINECSHSQSAIRLCSGVNPTLSKVVLTDKGRQYLQAPGSIVKDNEAAFVVAHFQVLRITEVHREGPDSVVASFEWQQKPTEVGRLFEPTIGLHTHIAKALFRLNEKKEWTLVSPDQTTSDPHYREFSISAQIFDAIDKENNK
jgi:hypothetical protein